MAALLCVVAAVCLMATASGIFAPDKLKAALAGIQPDEDNATTTVPAPSKPSLWPLAAITAAGNLADAGTTWQALSSGRGQEANPGLPNSAGKIMGIKAAATVPEVLVEKYLQDHGHPTAAKIAALAIGGLGGALAFHNSQVGR